MTFTTDDLKRFKEMPMTWPLGRHFNHEDMGELLALLARLEAAEACIDDHDKTCLADIGRSCSCGYSDKLQVWRKSKGE